MVQTFDVRFAREMENSERSGDEKERLIASGNAARTQERDRIRQLRKDHDDIQTLKGLDGDMDEWSTSKEAAVLLDEVKDIREELVILRSLLSQQEHVLETLSTNETDRFTANELDEMIKLTDTIQGSVWQACYT